MDENSKKSSSSQANYIVVWVVVITIILGIYYLFVSKPKSDIREIQIQESYINQRAENNRNNLTDCLNAVDEKIRNEVQGWCKTASQIKPNFPNEKFIDLGTNCSLPEKLLEPFAQGWEKQKKEGKEECYRLYPQ
jgi:hypothetical protein